MVRIFNVCHKLHYIKTFMQILVFTNFYWRIVSKFNYLEYKKNLTIFGQTFETSGHSDKKILLKYLFFLLRIHIMRLFFFQKKLFFLHFNKKTKGFHMRHYFFLYYGCFFQNRGKDFIWTNMHTTVHSS